MDGMFLSRVGAGTARFSLLTLSSLEVTRRLSAVRVCNRTMEDCLVGNAVGVFPTLIVSCIDRSSGRLSRTCETLCRGFVERRRVVEGVSCSVDYGSRLVAPKRCKVSSRSRVLR
jgi:hypothetical protein